MSQAQTTSLAELRGAAKPIDPAIRAGFDTVGGFDLIQRTAKLFASSNIVPTQFQGNLPNCVIAVDMALRMGANPLMVCQNLYIVHGRPAWSAQFLIATMNQCGRFSAIRYEFQGKQGTDEWGCKAVATELATKEKLEGPLITIGLAKKEGWYGKNGSKWQTMPELMLRYRAASWFVRAYAPEIAMGLQTAEEVKDTFDLEPSENGTYSVTTDSIKPLDHQPAQGEVIDMSTGEVTQKEPVPAREKAPVSQPKPPVQKVERAAPKEPAQAPQQSTFTQASFPCPKTDGERMVTEDDCGHCKQRTDCPAWSVDFSEEG